MERDTLIEYILSFMPLLHKKLFKDFKHCEISKQQMQLLFHIKHENGKPMKYYGNKLMISKPNLTTVVNKLIEEGLIERERDTDDRRIINLTITEKGDHFLTSHREIIKQNMLKRLEVLSDEDINRLNKNFEEMKAIFSKLD